MNEEALPCFTYFGISFNCASSRQAKHASDAMILATEKRFLPKYCAEGIEGLAADVYDCYQQTQSSDPKHEQCLIADFMVLRITKLLNERDTALGQSAKYNMPFFTSMEVGKRADKFIKNSSKFKDYTMHEFATYLANSFRIVFDDYDKLDKETNGDCSSFF